MIVDFYNKRSQSLYIDNDKEEFKFYTKHVSVQEYIAYWKQGINLLRNDNIPIILPTYIEYEGDEIDVQGYIIYPYGSAWILIDSGLKLPLSVDISNAHKYIAPIDTELPQDEDEWQSHWWLSGEDMNALAACVGSRLSLEKGVIPTEPLRFIREDDIIKINADRQSFNIEFGVFENEQQVRSYSRNQLTAYINKEKPYAILPSGIVDGKVLLLFFFYEDSTNYLAQFSIDCQNNRVNFSTIDAYMKKTRNRPYIIESNPPVYTLHARFKLDAAGKLLDILDKNDENALILD